MSYQVTARKWRPMIFDDVIGQEHVISTLKNAISTNRVAHAYIFSGTRGCGKTTTARILSRALNCSSPQNFNPDNTCDICKEIIEGRSLDVVEIDGASNRGVDEIRNLRDSVRYTPTHGKNKIYIIDEVHMLTKEAFNALLKTLEEPPAHVVFIFATTEIHKVPSTILSRCQRFDFKRIEIDKIIKSLSDISKAENIIIENDALVVIAKRADGSLRDAQSIFDQVRSFCGSNIKTSELLKAFNVVDQELYFKLTSILKSQDSAAIIKLVDDIIKNGYDMREFLNGLLEHFRNLLITLSTHSVDLIEASEYFKNKYKSESINFSEQDLLRYIKLANDISQQIKWSTQPRYNLEAGLVQMAKMEPSVQISDIIKQIEHLKKNSNLNFNSSEQNTTLSNKTIIDKPEQNQPNKINTFSKNPIKESFENTQAKIVHNNSTLNNKIDKNEIVNKWQEFIAHVAKTHIAVSVILKSTNVLSVENNLVKIGCPDDYHKETLQRNREFLCNILYEIYGIRLGLDNVISKTVIETTPTNIYQNNNNENPNNSSKPDNSNEPKHPVLDILKSELDIVKINKD